MTKQIYERRVAKGFTDKNTKDAYVKGSVYKSDDEVRINELVHAGHLEGEEVKSLVDAQKELSEKADGKVETAVKSDESETADQLKHVGGGYYLLPNGEKVQGKENAEQALAEAGE